MALGTISKLMTERVDTFKEITDDILEVFSEKLTSAFQIIYNAQDKKLNWTTIDAIAGTEKAVIVSGYMELSVGEVIRIGDKDITLDEMNVSQYNKFVKFAFPIIMLELATVEELVEHIKRLSAIGSVTDITPEALVKIVDKIATEYENSILEDPMKVKIIDAATKPNEILGFPTENLTDDQIRTLTMFAKAETRTLN